MIVAAGPASRELASKVGAQLSIRVMPVEFKHFSDGESYIRFPDELKDEVVVVVQSTYPPQDVHLTQLFLMLDAARDLGSRLVVAVVPYLAYMRQDKRFRSGEAVSVGTVAKLVEASGAGRFITFDLHGKNISNLFRIPAENLSATRVLGEYLSKLSLRNPYFFAPDVGTARFAEAVASVLGAESAFFEKQRDRVTGQIVTATKSVDVKGRDAVIVDDIVSTGSTVVSAARILREQGAKDIYVACTHPLLLGDARLKLEEAGVKTIVGTDCVASKVSVVSVASVVAESLRKLM